MRRPTQPAGLEDAEVASVRSTAWKYVLTFDRRTRTVREELYDLAEDPGERHDLSGDAEARARLDRDAELAAAVAALRARHPAVAAPGQPPAERGK